MAPADWLAGLDPARVAKYDALLSTRPTGALVIDTCEPSHADHEGEERQHVKHRPMPDNPNARGKATVADTISAWQPPCSEASCNGDSPYATEQDIFRIDGDAWRIEVDPGDCDVHIEMAEPGGSATDGRMIVEIPNDPQFTRLRHLLDDAVFARTTRHLGSDKQLTNALPLHVVGYRFWDGHHVCKNHQCPHPEHPAPGEHCSHGTRFVCGVWELHPVLAVGVRE